MPILSIAALIALLDGLFPMVVYFYKYRWGVVQRVLQSIAAGVLGKASFDGGAATAFLGLFFHCLIATVWTCIYTFVVRRVALVQRLTRTTKGTVLVGTMYGAFIWLTMNYVVIALSRATVASAAKWPFWSQLVWHMSVLGPTIVLLTERQKAREARGATAGRAYGTPASSPV